MAELAQKRYGPSEGKFSMSETQAVETEALEAKDSLKRLCEHATALFGGGSTGQVGTQTSGGSFQASPLQVEVPEPESGTKPASHSCAQTEP
jgi:hypothetical protein